MSLFIYFLLSLSGHTLDVSDIEIQHTSSSNNPEFIRKSNILIHKLKIHHSWKV